MVWSGRRAVLWVFGEARDALSIVSVVFCGIVRIHLTLTGHCFSCGGAYSDLPERCGKAAECDWSSAERGVRDSATVENRRCNGLHWRMRV